MNILKIVSEFTRLHRTVFFNKIFEDDYLKAEFFKILKNASESDKKFFFQGLNDESIKAWDERLKDTSICNSEELKKAEGVVAPALDAIEREINELEESTKLGKEKILSNRKLMLSDFPGLSKVISDQTLGIPIPELPKPNPETIITLPEPTKCTLGSNAIFDCIKNRESRRKFTDAALSQEELSYLLWATQGVRKTIYDGKITFRTVPSGGARHAFETYLAINHVENIKSGIYRYCPLEHQLEFLFETDNMKEKLTEASLGQGFVGECAVVFIWSAVPYRMEWRYTIESAKIILLDAGHVCQNLYLAVESIGCGTCAIGAYDQGKFDSLLKLDGKDEFTVYLSPVGKLE